jgi:glycosyltransferase involved in cell wall biosynthesis
MVLISVIIPVLNAEKTIIPTVQSVLRQSLVDLEVIIIDDGSTDQTFSVLTQIQDSRLSVIHFLNAGVAASRNRGIQRANGKYISFLDADDLWMPDKLKDQYESLSSHPESAVAYSWVNYVDSQYKFLHSGWHIQHSGDVYEELFCRNFIENGSNILVRKQAVETIGNFDADTSPSEDWDFYLRLAEKFSFVCVPKVQVLYRVTPGSLSTQIRRMESGFLRAFDKAIVRSPQRLAPLKTQALATFYSYLFHKAYTQAITSQQWITSLNILLKGLYRSPKTWNFIAKRRIAKAILGIFGVAV